MGLFERGLGVIPDVPEEITAWRSWAIADPFGREPRLTSITDYGLYEPWPTAGEGGMTAHCRCPWRWRRHRHVPGRPQSAFIAHLAPWTVHATGFGCGIYGTRTYEDLAGSSWWGSHVVGMVRMGGRVYEHEGGFRSEKAAVGALIGRWMNLETEALRTLLNKLAKFYDVPIISEQEAYDYGRDRKAGEGGAAPGPRALDAPGAGEGAESGDPVDPGDGSDAA